MGVKIRLSQLREVYSLKAFENRGLRREHFGVREL